ncbi:MAG: ABC transporter substrate-binding protein, partial [Bacteroidetes bacterium]|nr:ABC transporter substrate-binding protein [Bacteroidota bacterium]
IADYPDPESFLAAFYSPNPAGPNYSRFANVAFDSLYVRAIREPDEKKRMSYYISMDSIIIEELPVIGLYYDQVVRFSSKGIEGLGINAMNLLSLKNVRMKLE